MKQPKFVGVLLSCLLLVSSGMVLPAFAEEETSSGKQTDAAEVQETTSEAEVQNDAEPVHPAEAEPAAKAGAVKDVVSVTLSLSEQPDDAENGFVYAEDGSVSYLLDGKKLTGRFSISTDYLKGDLGGDGVVDTQDATLVLKAIAEAAVNCVLPEEIVMQENASLSTVYQADQIADINGDGSIDVSDASAILEYISKQGAGEALKPLGCGQFYADAEGVLQQGWITDGKETFYGGKDYMLLEGWKRLEGDTYYFSEDAVLQTGYLEFQDNTYFLGANGVMVTGWLDAGDAMYYFDTANGMQAFGVKEINGDLYYFDETGALLSGGWLTSEDGLRYADDRGALLTSFQTVDGVPYYFDVKNGIMASGISTIGGGTYYFLDDGTQQFGWFDFEDGSHYFDETSGKMAVGFTAMEDGTRYFNEDGVMLTDWQDIGENQYYFDAEGLMQTGLIVMDGHKYRFEEDGVYNPITICLDAGHYAKYNHSPVNTEYWESDFTWKMHLYLKEALEAYDIEVITTREDKDTDLGLETRGKMSEGCDLFLSLHSNACGTESIDAPLACCQINGSADELGLLLAQKVAEVMETRQDGTIWKRQGNHGDYYGVLRGAASVGTPGILLEHSYHTNKRATEWLLNDENVKRMAEAEAELLAEYFGMIE